MAGPGHVEGELTHAWPALLALLIASSSAYAVSALLLKRSVLTEKIARRGHHLSRDYDVDPLDVLFVDEVMHADPTTLHPDEPLPAALRRVRLATVPRPGRGQPATAVPESASFTPVTLPADAVPPAPRPPSADEFSQRLFPVVDGGLLVGVLRRHHLEQAGAPAPGRPRSSPAGSEAEATDVLGRTA